MRLLFSEFSADYKKYHFPYQVYLLKEETDTYSSIYENGFLPTRIDERLFYLARSLRIELDLFELSSENRRIKKKVSDLKIKLIDYSDFVYNFEIGKMGKDFYDQRFGKGTMSAQKIKWLFTSGAMTHILEYSQGNEVVGYCPVIMDDQILHYSYPFHDIEKVGKNLGMGMMISAIELANSKGVEYVYLGTVYTEKSLYKTQFSGLQYYTGMGWSEDVEQLKSQIREPFDGHLLEMIEDKTQFFTELLS